MTPIENILSRLDKPRQRQAGQWSARCPAHDDKGPSLSIRETPDGSALIHCFGGCTPLEVVGALGLDLVDLFPPRERPSGAPRKTARVLTAGQALELLHTETNVVAVAAGNIAFGTALTDADRKRALHAAGRIAYLREEALG